MSPEVTEHSFPIVGVGASAGGLEALTRLIGALPPEPGLAMVVVQHLDPHYQSQLSTILQSQSSIPVVEAVHGVKVQPDRVYVIQPNTNVALADGILSVTPRPDDRRPHYPVDHFLRSLAAVQGRTFGWRRFCLARVRTEPSACRKSKPRAESRSHRTSARRSMVPCRKARLPVARSIWCCHPRRSPRDWWGCRRIPI